MVRSRTEKIVNLITAVLVLLAGLYVIVFLPLRFSGMTRVLLGLLIIVYFSWRMRSILRRPEEDEIGKRRGSLRDE